MQLLDYPQYYRNHGIRMVNQLVTPPIDDLSNFILPKNTIFHFVPDTDVISGPDTNEIFFNYTREILPISHVSQLVTFNGSPMKTTETENNLVKAFHRKARKYKLVINPEKYAMRPAIPYIVNYALLNKLFRYTKNTYTEYNRRLNIQNTVIHWIVKYANMHNSQQFIAFRIPDILPTKQMLDNFDHIEVNVNMAKIFDTDEELYILELWKLLGDNPHTSRLYSFKTDISNGGLSRINFILMSGNKWVTLNLGTIFGWRQHTVDEIKADPSLKKTGIRPKSLQISFLALLVNLNNITTLANETKQIEDDNTVTTSNGVNQVKIEDTALEKTYQENKKVLIEKDKLKETETKKDEVVDDSFLKELEETINGIDKINERVTERKRFVQDTDLTTKVKAITSTEDIIKTETPKTLSESIISRANELAETGAITAKELLRAQEQSENYKKIISPDGKTTLDKYIQVPKEILSNAGKGKIPATIAKTIDTELDESILTRQTKDYVTQVLDKHIAHTILGLQRGGIIVNDYTVTQVDSILGSSKIHTIKIHPIGGNPSTLKFPIPVPDENGVFKIGGINYKLRKQKGDTVIRKIFPDQVALTTAYGKLFASRSIKKTSDYTYWISNLLMGMALDIKDDRVTQIKPYNCFDLESDYPRIVSSLAMTFASMNLNNYTLNFDIKKMKDIYKENELKFHSYADGNGFFLLGKNKSNQLLLVDSNNIFYTCSANAKSSNDYAIIGTIITFLGIPDKRHPLDYSAIKVLGRSIPIAFILGYYKGLFPLIKLLSTKEPRLIPNNTRGLTIDPNYEYDIRFNDTTIVLQKDDKLCTMIMSGFLDVKNEIAKYNIDEFNKPNVYYNIFSKYSVASKLVKKLNSLRDFFIDPLSMEWLEDHKQPRTFDGLLIESSRLLLDDKHTREYDGNFAVYKGYQRFNNSVYGEIIRAVEAASINDGKIKTKVELNQFAIWGHITTDPAVSIASEINPLQEIKEEEAITYNGHGGRSSQTMVKETRKFDPNDLYVISENTSDSGDVGINVYSTGNPAYSDLLGNVTPKEDRKFSQTNILSTCGAMMPFNTRDDAKRANFGPIQTAHTVACDSYEQPYIGTGVEYTIAHRTSSSGLFAVTAKKPGKVIAITEKAIKVEYNDGEIKGYELGTRFGSAAGLTIPHTVVTELKVGDKVPIGKEICYNPGFFTRDYLYPDQIVCKMGVMMTFALIEGEGVIEDACLITKDAGNKLTTEIAKPKTIVVNFNQPVKDLVEVGQVLDTDTILCAIGDEVSADSSVFDSESVDTLRAVSSQTPQAKVRGVVKKIEVFYNGDKEDMCDSLRKLTNKYDRVLSKEFEELGQKVFTGKVDEGFRIDGESLLLDNVAIRISITQKVPAGIGDKVVLANQMKSIISGILLNEVTTESGRKIDGLFSSRSCDARIVNSPFLMGAAASLLEFQGKIIANEFLS